MTQFNQRGGGVGSPFFSVLGGTATNNPQQMAQMQKQATLSELVFASNNGPVTSGGMTTTSPPQ